MVGCVRSLGHENQPWVDLHIYISADVLCFCWVRFAGTKKEKQRNTQKKGSGGTNNAWGGVVKHPFSNLLSTGNESCCKNVATSKVYFVYQQEGHQETELAVTSECQVENVNSIHQHPACLPPEVNEFCKRTGGQWAGHVALAIPNNIINSVAAAKV